jgi:hypothetical protein
VAFTQRLQRGEQGHDMERPIQIIFLVRVGLDRRRNNSSILTLDLLLYIFSKSEVWRYVRHRIAHDG